MWTIDLPQKSLCKGLIETSFSFIAIPNGRLAEWSLSRGGPASVPPLAAREYFCTVPGVRDDSPAAAWSQATHMGVNWRG